MPSAMRSMLFLSIVAGAGCQAKEPPLEEQAGRPEPEKSACATPPAPDYEPAKGTEGLAVEVVDCGFAYPTSIAISPDGALVFVGQLKGQVYVSEKADGRFVFQEQMLYDLGDLGISNEAGLTGLTLAPRFDVDSQDAERRDLFLAYQFRGDDGFAHNRVTRLTVERRDGLLVGTERQDIFTGTESSEQAHQIHGGVAFEMLGATHLLFAVGDAHSPANGRDPKTTNGTFLMIQRDGRPPLGGRPWPEYPMSQGLGVRNVFGLELLPEEVDPRRGLVGLENGDFDSDRAWLVHPIDFAGNNTRYTDIGYDGDDTARSWLHVPDPAVENEAGEPRNAVFHIFKPVISPTAVSIHPGGGMIPPSDQDGASLVAAFYGNSARPDLGPGKNVQLLRLQNVRKGALAVDVTVLVQRRENTFGRFRNPVGLDVDPTDGSIYFADIMSGVLYRIRVGG